MKKIFLVLVPAFLAVACVHENEVYVGPGERTVYCEAFENYEVPVKAGFSTIVTCNNDTLAVTDEPLTIKVPKGSVLSTRSESALKVDFAVLQNTTSYSKWWQAIMFEDTEHGDYDYNDLVIHISNRLSNGGADADLQTISIQPIALGSTKDIKLGCILADNSEHIIAENVRQELFNGEKGFINTKNELAPIRYKLQPKIVDYKLPKKAVNSIAWFIEVEGKRFYAVTSDFDYRAYDMFNEEGMPYGLIVARDNGTFNYPQEEISIFKVYPDFGAWINGKVSNIGTYNKELVCKYCYSHVPGKDGKLHKIWDYEDLED